MLNIDLEEGYDVADDSWSDLAIEFRPTAVIHLAAEHQVDVVEQAPLEAWRTNVLGTLRTLQIAHAAGATRFVLASSSAVYGDGAHRVAPDTHYGRQKLAAEGLVRNFPHMVRVSLRYFNVFGRGQNEQSGAVVASFVSALERGQAATVYGNGLQVRDYVPVSAVVRATVAAASRPMSERANGHVADICTGRGLTVLEVAERLGVPLMYEAPRRGDVAWNVGEPELARRYLDWECPPSEADAAFAELTVDAIDPVPEHKYDGSIVCLRCGKGLMRAAEPCER